MRKPTKAVKKTKTRKARRKSPPLRPNDAPSRFGARVRQLRLERALLLEDAAKRAKMTIPALSEVENGKRWRGTVLNLYRLADAIGCSVRNFFEEEN